jgi:hypothetical protein
MNRHMGDQENGIFWQDGVTTAVPLKTGHSLYNIITLIMEMQALRNRKSKGKGKRGQEEAGESREGRERHRKGIAESKHRFGYWRRSEQLKYISFLEANYLIMKNA